MIRTSQCSRNHDRLVLVVQRVRQSMRILLVEDDPEMAIALRSALASADIIVDLAPTIDLATAAIAITSYDVIVLDRGLPDGDGLTLLADLRGTSCDTPVIVLTAKGDVADRIDGLDVGADDYMVKPFSTEELLARLRAVQRRPSALAPSTVRAGRLVFDMGQRVATIGDMHLSLPRRELLLLEVLVRRLGRTVQRAIIEDAVYGFDDEIQSNSLDAHVSRLRKKLTEGGARVEIHGIRGVGYLLKPS
ncbi:response regulator transcription factor [Sphingomonas oligophenolica]|uniref:response regulator transcription factor n=1 Tax=Sphingomonas oligophenolica TaxID=301154 RepID=UPI0031D2FA63